MGLERLVDHDKERFIGKHALDTERVRGSQRRIVGLGVDWPEIEALYDAVGLAPSVPATTSRTPVPVFADGKQVGRMTSSTWSPILKQMIGLATIDSAHAMLGTRLRVEHTVDAVRSQAAAVVVQTPFFSPKRKTARPE
jgi:aminomethyltransferase